jgi:plastocyanin domain-containing protein
MRLVRPLLLALVFSTPAALAAPAKTPTPAKPVAAPAPARAQRVNVTVTAKGFVVDAPKVKAGQPVTLVVTRQVERTCATDIVLKDYGISQPLPLGKPVEVTFTPARAGKVHYACAMDMIAGELVAE